MTSWKRVAADKRSLIMPLVVAVVANVAVYVLAVYPLSRRQASVQDRATAAAAGRAAAEEELAAARALVDGKIRAEEELSTFYNRVLPADLSAARRLTYASLPTLARKTDVTWSSRNTQVAEASEDGRLGHLAIRMQLEGDYERIRQFIYELESAPEFIIIDDVTLAQNEAGRPQSLTLTLSAYYRLGPNGI